MPGVTDPVALAAPITVNVDEPWMGYDYLVKIPTSQFYTEDDDQQHISTFWSKARDIHTKLVQGLADRVTHVNIVVPKAPRDALEEATLNIGLVVEPSVALRAVDRGPTAEDKPKSKAFRALWESKAELRRFKDGSILESAVWSSSEANALLREIISHLLETHIGKRVTNGWSLVGNDFNAVIPAFNPSLAIFDPVSTAYKALEHDIRTAEGLPLQIKQIKPASPALGYGSIDLPLAQGARPADPMDVVVQFEGSARWPDDLQAIQMTKIAFLLKLEDALSEKVSKTFTRIGIENEHSDVINRAYLQVAYPSNATFNVRIQHEREQTLIERNLKSNDISPRNREAAATALASYKRSFECRPMHCQAVQVIATRYPSLSATIRLVKRWFNAHMLGPHFAEQLIEIMTIRAFVHSHPWKPPTSAQTGFLRTLLFLARWDWQHEPLLVDFTGNTKSAEMQAAITRFEAWRNIDPAMNRVAIFAATNYDTDGTTWTEYSPSKVVVSRMSSLAAAAHKAIQQQGLELDISAVFKPSVRGFDFVIHLNKKFVRHQTSSKSSSIFKNIQHGVISDNSLAGYDPISSYVAELRSLYDEILLLFHDPSGGKIIAGVWDPTKGKRRWKVHLPYSTEPLEPGDGGAETVAVVNRGAIMSEMARLGGDLVHSITTSDSATQ